MSTYGFNCHRTFGPKTEEGSQGLMRSITCWFVFVSQTISIYLICVASCELALRHNISTNASPAKLERIPWQQTRALQDGYEYLQYIGQRTVFHNKCDSKVAVYAGSHVFLTIEGFYSNTDALTMPTDMQQAATPVVTSAAFVSESRLLLVVSGRLYSYDLRSQQYTALAMTGNVTTVHVASHCHGLYSIAAVTVNTSTDQIFLSLDLDTWKEVSLSSLSLPSNQGVVDFSLVPVYSAIVVLTKIEETVARFAKIDFYTANVTATTMQPFAVIGDVHFKALDQPSGSLLVWDSARLYYSSNAGQSILPVTVTGFTNHSGSISVAVVALGSQGDYAVLTTDGLLLFGRQLQAIQIASDINISEDTAVLFDAYGNVEIIGLDRQSGLPSVKQVVPTWNAMSKDCQLQALEVSLEEGVLHYLDKRRSLNVTVTLTTQPWLDNQILVTVTRPELLTLETTVHPDEVLHPGILAKRLSVEMKDVIISAASSVHTTYTSKPAICNNVNGLEFAAHGDDHSLAEYNSADWGCPIQVYYADSLLLIVDLYHGNDFIEEVQVDFVVHEEFNHTDFSYRLSATAAGCIGTPQDWASMLINSSDTSHAWTRENYEHCFSDNRAATAGPALPGQTYEIINSSNRNSLRWKHNGYYIYTLTVLNPDYSFCHLQTQFAVHVHGVLPDTTYGHYTLPLTSVGLCLSVVLAYVIFEKLLKKPGDKTDQEN
ncbi:cation channel sperm-associated auxiliary subunit delta-like isoform X2 [Ptychodera flava]|uniref:cation channel sperm-associated auxiliary subunit delta-like isoform X2 n=1 Tax=Ptychodera flava TaxID=63121 RepID=UPI00396A62D2